MGDRWVEEVLSVRGEGTVGGGDDGGEKAFELPKKYVIGNFELVCDRLIVGGDKATGDGRGLGPSVDGKRGLKERLGFKWS